MLVISQKKGGLIMSCVICVLLFAVFHTIYSARRRYSALFFLLYRHMRKSSAKSVKKKKSIVESKQS